MHDFSLTQFNNKEYHNKLESARKSKAFAALWNMLIPSIKLKQNIYVPRLASSFTFEESKRYDTGEIPIGQPLTKNKIDEINRGKDADYIIDKKFFDPS